MADKTKRETLSSSQTPFATPTLAEIYIRQGHLSQGLAIYQRLLRGAPSDPQLQKRVAELSEELHGPKDLPLAVDGGSKHNLQPAVDDKEAVSKKEAGQSELLEELSRWLTAIEKRRRHV